MKLKKKILNQSFLRKLLTVNPNFLIFCTSNLTIDLEYKYKKLCKNNFKLPKSLFSFDYSSQVHNVILCKDNVSLLIIFLKVNYYQLANYGFTFLYFNFLYFKEFSAILLYFFEPKKFLYFFKRILGVKETLSSSNGKDIALSR